MHLLRCFLHRTHRMNRSLTAAVDDPLSHRSLSPYSDTAAAAAASPLPTVTHSTLCSDAADTRDSARPHITGCC